MRGRLAESLTLFIFPRLPMWISAAILRKARGTARTPRARNRPTL